MDIPRESVLDRLIDEDPDASADPPPTRAGVLRRIQAAVKRDLENLLNTRYRCVAWPPRCEELDESLTNYGIPDFTAAGLDAAHNSDVLLEAIAAAIRLFEKRLRDVRVDRVTDGYSIDRTFRFRIRGTLMLDPDEHPVQFDSSLESVTGQFEVR